MHSSVIDEILKVEDDAGKLVSDAEEKARRIIFDAEAEKKAYIQSEVEKVRAEGKKRLDEEERILEEHLKEYEAMRDEIERKANKLPQSVIETAAERVIERILKVDGNYGQG